MISVQLHTNKFSANYFSIMIDIFFPMLKVIDSKGHLSDVIKFYLIIFDQHWLLLFFRVQSKAISKDQ